MRLPPNSVIRPASTSRRRMRENVSLVRFRWLATWRLRPGSSIVPRLLRPRLPTGIWPRGRRRRASTTSPISPTRSPNPERTSRSSCPGRVRGLPRAVQKGCQGQQDAGGGLDGFGIGRALNPPMAATSANVSPGPIMCSTCSLPPGPSLKTRTSPSPTHVDARGHVALAEDHCTLGELARSGRSRQTLEAAVHRGKHPAVVPECLPRFRTFRRCSDEADVDSAVCLRRASEAWASSRVTVVCGSMERVSQTLEPITESWPITVSPPRTVALA